jgi:uncharacterized protein YbaR (Trm112 family)
MEEAVELLICPGCRTASEGRIDVRTLARNGEFLVCECGRRYPVVDGVPIVMADPSEFLRGEMTTIVERDLAPEVAAALVEHGPDDLVYARLLEHLSIYMDAHWGDRAEPAPDGVEEAWALRPIVERIRALPRARAAIELGCSVGRVLAEMATESAYGLELQFGAVRRARRLLAGERVSYARRMIGRTYAAASATGMKRDGVTLVCGDALNAPFVPGAFDRVVALNLLDSVAHPRQLLAVIDALCEVGGEIVLASPYAWQSSVMGEQERFGGLDPAGTLREILAGGLSMSYAIVDEAEVPWTLRRDARSTVTYRTHFVRARKGT